MTDDIRVVAGIIGAISGASVSALINIIIWKRNRAQTYYAGLVKLITDHNWSMLKEKLSDGLPITETPRAVAIACYQHINILFYVWLHKNVVHADGSLPGWRRWSASIVRGAFLPQNDEHRKAYIDILKHGDLYPQDFIRWLDTELGLRFRAFESSKQPETRAHGE